MMDDQKNVQYANLKTLGGDGKGVILFCGQLSEKMSYKKNREKMANKKMNTDILTKWQNIRTSFSYPLQSKEPLFTLRLHREIAAQGTKLRDESYLASGGNQIHMKQRSPTNQTCTLVLRVPFQTMYCQFGRILIGQYIDPLVGLWAFIIFLLWRAQQCWTVSFSSSKLL